MDGRSARRVRSRWSSGPLFCAAFALTAQMLSVRQPAAQTLARPGWRGSGMHAERWWRDAVFYAAGPADTQDGGDSPRVLEQIDAHLDEVQALGCDAILLRDVSTVSMSPPHRAGTQAGAAETTAVEAAAPATGSAPLNPQLGTLEQFDRLLADASRRRIRVVVELAAVPREDNGLAAEARFWLSRGVSGIAVRAATADAARSAVRLLRPVLRPFVGERVLLGEADEMAAAETVRSSTTAPTEAAPRRTGRRQRGTAAAGAGVAAGGEPDLWLRSLRGLPGADAPGSAPDLARLRQAFAASGPAGLPRGTGAAPGTVWQVRGTAQPVSPDAARAVITVLLSAPGGVALRAADLAVGLEASRRTDADAIAAATAGAPAAPPDPTTTAAVSAPTASPAAGAPADAVPTSSTRSATPDPTLAWTERMLALHRGNSALRSGTPMVLDHDTEGVLAIAWRPAGAPALVEMVNLSAKPVTLSITDDLTRARLRGTFLRTVLRSDAGMGAMPLRAVTLAPYGVYLGQLSR